jgi:hypothetical protein
MKWIFLLLLVTNIAILLWGWRQGVMPATLKPAIEAGMGNLRLLSRPGEPMLKMIPPPFSDEADLTDGQEPATVETVEAASEEDREESPVAAESAVETTSAEAPITDETGGEEDKAAGQEAVLATDAGSANIEQLQSSGLSQRAATAESEPAQLAEVAPELPVEVPEKPVPVPPEMCGSIGPIDDSEIADSIVNELKQRSINTSLQQESYQKTTGFWVIIPPFPTRQQAIDTVNRLKQQGVEDTGRFYKGEFRNGVSLGIFSRQKNAERRRDLIAAKGFDPSVVPRIRDVTVYRIDYRASESEPGQALQTLISRYPELEHQEQGCPGEGTIADPTTGVK